jgi:SpoVK/Ycf46/Vps4 family AAA+-type ATPase
VWDTCRGQARTQLSDLAQRIEPVATWDDLVLPEQQRQILHDINQQVRKRTTVYERSASRGAWARHHRPVRRQAAPGKTMAAEVLANELRLDLYARPQFVVSKYIGETEKNLRRCSTPRRKAARSVVRRGRRATASAPT